MSPKILIGLIACMMVSTGCGKESGVARPEPTRVLDTADALSESQRRSIEDYLEFVRSTRSIDYRVVLLDDPRIDLVPEGASRYARMEIGTRTEGRGLLLLVNVGAAEARVEVGYGLEHRVRDAEASSMIDGFLAPYFSSGEVASGVEASVERLVDVLEPGREERQPEPSLIGSGGAGATGALPDDIEGLTPDTKTRLREILVPQARPEDCVHLEIALMHRGIYYRDVPMYDEAWRRAQRPDFPADRLRTFARTLDGPFAVERVGDHAITYFAGAKGVRWGPQFLRRTEDGWIIDASSVAKSIVYDYSNRFWYAVEGDYPYLALVKSVYDMKRVSLSDRGPAWMIDTPSSRGTGTREPV